MVSVNFSGDTTSGGGGVRGRLDKSQSPGRKLSSFEKDGETGKKSINFLLIYCIITSCFLYTIDFGIDRHFDFPIMYRW